MLLRTLALSAILWIAVSAIPHAVQATQIVQKSFGDLGRDAELVVQGRVTAVQSYWNESKTKILTETQALDLPSAGSNAGETERAIWLGAIGLSGTVTLPRGFLRPPGKKARRSRAGRPRTGAW